MAAAVVKFIALLLTKETAKRGLQQEVSGCKLAPADGQAGARTKAAHEEQWTRR